MWPSSRSARTRPPTSGQASGRTPGPTEAASPSWRATPWPARPASTSISCSSSRSPPRRRPSPARLIGVPTLRLRGDYIAVVTLAFGEIIGQIVSNGRSIEFFGGTLTSGPIGIGPIDRIELPLIGRFEALNLRPWYWFALALVALALIVNVNLRDSRIGRSWIAIRQDERLPPAPGSPSSAPSSSRMGRAPRTAGSRARSSPRIWASSTRASSSTPSRSSSWRWSWWEASDRFRASWSARSSSRWSTTTCCPTSCTTFQASSAWRSTCRRSALASTARSSSW